MSCLFLEPNNFAFKSVKKQLQVKISKQLQSEVRLLLIKIWKKNVKPPVCSYKVQSELIIAIFRLLNLKNRNNRFGA